MIKLTEEQRSRFQRFSEYVIAMVEVSLENYLALNSFIEKHIEEKQSEINATTKLMKLMTWMPGILN